MHHCWFNGKITEVDKVQYHFNDLGLLRGFGIFDYFRTYNGRPFQWDWYWERYTRSAKLLGIPNPISKEEAYNVLMELYKLQDGEDCAYRFLLTGGFVNDSITMIKPNLIIVSENIVSPISDEYETGIGVMSYDFVRSMPAIKTTDYKFLLHLRPELKEKGFSDILLHYNGLISELSRSNVFIVKNNVLITPKNDILEGITRKTVLDLAKNDFEIQIRDVSLQETLEADEFFTTSTTKKVLPITRVDEHKIGAGEVGKVSKELLRRIDTMIEKW